MSTTGDTGSISVIIPVKNGATTIGQCLEALFGQSVRQRMEVILIDSGSTDGTLEIAAGFPVKIVRIEPAGFDHGLTRNLAVGHATGDLVYLTVQDARLADARALERMAAWFRDPAVMAVCGIQGVPHEKDTNPVYWYRPVSAPTVDRLQFPGPD
ncbi:MAG TPA: glycosyltransferase, partial [Puia sp.]|nr:glycosyltransferase [Puia sp.]